jgi:16S rRNA (guanine527-N7)-methyltransferase
VKPREVSRLAALREQWALPATFDEAILAVLRALEHEPVSLTTVRDPAEGVDAHVADSLEGLAVPALRGAARIADLGSGAGFPGLVLAAALPSARVALVESVARKGAWLTKAAALAGVEDRVEVVIARAEAWPAGLAAHDVVTARALAPLTVLVEYAAPLLVEGGTLVAYKGRRDAAEEAVGAAAAAKLGMSGAEVVRISPSRHLHLYSKVSPTPPGFPRREGMARKRPITA